MKNVAAVLLMVPAIVASTAGPASATDPVQSNVVERVECMFRVYVTEGGESGLDCLA